MSIVTNYIYNVIKIRTTFSENASKIIYFSPYFIFYFYFYAYRFCFHILLYKNPSIIFKPIHNIHYLEMHTKQYESLLFLELIYKKNILYLDTNMYVFRRTCN